MVMMLAFVLQSYSWNFRLCRALFRAEKWFAAMQHDALKVLFVNPHFGPKHNEGLGVCGQRYDVSGRSGPAIAGSSDTQLNMDYMRVSREAQIYCATVYSCSFFSGRSRFFRSAKSVYGIEPALKRFIFPPDFETVKKSLKLWTSDKNTASAQMFFP